MITLLTDASYVWASRGCDGWGVVDSIVIGQIGVSAGRGCGFTPVFVLFIQYLSEWRAEFG